MNPREGLPALSSVSPPALLVSAREAARLCGFARSTWWRLLSAGRIPAPVYIGSEPRWRVEELRGWLAVGCPARDAWRWPAGRELDAEGILPGKERR